MALAGAVSGFPALISKANAAEPVSVSTPLGFTLDFFDTMNAYSGGHYARQGLDCKVIGANNGVQMTQLVVSNQVTFGRGGTTDLFRLAAAHQPLPLSIASIDQDCVFRVYSLKDKPFREPKEFRGKVVGLITLASATGIYLDVMLAGAGMTPDDVERQAVGGTPGALEILKKGRVDCFIGPMTLEVAFQRAHEPVEVWNPDNYLPLPGQSYLAMKQTLAAKSNIAVRFLKAIKASVDEMFSEPLAPMVRRAAGDFDIPGVTDTDLAVAMIQASLKLKSTKPDRSDLLINVPSRWQAGADAMRRAKLSDISDASTLYTNEYVEKALKG
jgi:ABC-type nitrate/sulfonate/bicarbonate transport system substrate-binding protein